MYDFTDNEFYSTLQPQLATTNKGIVEYVEFGDGPAIVSIHGAMGGYDQSVILAQTIATAKYRYIAISRPGYLGTPIHSGKTPAQQADLIAELLTQLNITKAGIMAVSGGGPAALEFAIRHPQRCNGLVLCSTSADKTSNPIPLSFHIMCMMVQIPVFAKAISNKMSKKLDNIAGKSITEKDLLEKLMHDKETWGLFCKLIISTFDRASLRIAGTKNDINITRTASYNLEKIACPALIIHGTKDPRLNFARETKIYMSRLHNAQLLPLENGEHAAIFTHREIVKEAVANFLCNNFAI